MPVEEFPDHAVDPDISKAVTAAFDCVKLNVHVRLLLRLV